MENETLYMEEKIRQLQLDNRVLKKYTEDLRKEIDDLKLALVNKQKALNYSKELLMAKGVRDNAYEKIRLLELGDLRV